MDWYPLRFHPIYKERVWGGRSLSSLYSRTLPTQAPVGESWEISDRPGDISVVAEGPLAGLDLHRLLSADPTGLLGQAPTHAGRFPLLVKILDARQTLSLQVHPPPHLAQQLGGEPKTEMWFITDAQPGAELLAGLRPGTSRADFEHRLALGSVDTCFHRIPAQPGDAMLLPSGRVHALGAGLVLFEIQENSDTTYRVFDWNRTGLDGRPRELHIPQSLASIDFLDFAPDLVRTPWTPGADGTSRLLAQHPLFTVVAHRAPAGSRIPIPLPSCAILGVTRGELALDNDPAPQPLRPGDFALLPAALHQAALLTHSDAEWIIAIPGPGLTPPPSRPSR